ncbi:hypothetical protein PMAYCL1PPCAC_22777, partial [Pristionchus mayeri]
GNPICIFRIYSIPRFLSPIDVRGPRNIRTESSRCWGHHILPGKLDERVGTLTFSWMGSSLPRAEVKDWLRGRFNSRR